MPHNFRPGSPDEWIFFAEGDLKIAKEVFFAKLPYLSNFAVATRIQVNIWRY